MKKCINALLPRYLFGHKIYIFFYLRLLKWRKTGVVVKVKIYNVNKFTVPYVDINFRSKYNIEFKVDTKMLSYKVNIA